MSDEKVEQNKSKKQIILDTINRLSNKEYAKFDGELTIIEDNFKKKCKQYKSDINDEVFNEYKDKLGQYQAKIENYKDIIDEKFKKIKETYTATDHTILDNIKDKFEQYNKSHSYITEEIFDQYNSEIMNYEKETKKNLKVKSEQQPDNVQSNIQQHYFYEEIMLLGDLKTEIHKRIRNDKARETPDYIIEKLIDDFNTLNVTIYEFKEEIEKAIVAAKDPLTKQIDAFIKDLGKIQAATKRVIETDFKNIIRELTKEKIFTNTESENIILFLDNKLIPSINDAFEKITNLFIELKNSLTVYIEELEETEESKKEPLLNLFTQKKETPLDNKNTADKPSTSNNPKI